MNLLIKMDVVLAVAVFAVFPWEQLEPGFFSPMITAAAAAQETEKQQDPR